jgi:hypothetical protein
MTPRIPLQTLRSGYPGWMANDPIERRRSPIAPIGDVLQSALYGAAVAIGGGMWALSELRVAGKGVLGALDRR